MLLTCVRVSGDSQVNNVRYNLSLQTFNELLIRFLQPRAYVVIW